MGVKRVTVPGWVMFSACRIKGKGQAMPLISTDIHTQTNLFLYSHGGYSSVLCIPWSPI